MGNITFNGNTIDCYQGGDAGGKSIGLDIRSIRFLCSYLDGNSSFTMHDIQINDNTITSYSNSIYLPDIGIGQVMYTNSTGFMGNITLNNNTVYSDGGDGIFFINTASTLDIGSELHDNSTFSVNNIELRNNNITHADGDGMWVAALGAGYDIEDDAVFTLDSFMVANNTIIDSDTGLHVMELNLIDWCTPIITNNTITDCVVGISLESSNDNLIYNNYFNNTINAQDDGENTWNVTKISGANIIGGSYLGGNYWSDYDGVDQDSDGLGDTLTPYNSSGDIETDGDFHPLINITVVESGNNGGGTSSNQAPIAHAGGPYSGYVNHTISFSGSGSTDDTAVVGYHWDFTNDGIYDTGWLTTSTTTHTYTTIGTYTVNLQVKDGAGLTDTDTATVTITATTTQTYPPVAHAGGPYSGLTFQDITFVGSGSTDDGTITSYAWSFGDGTTGTGVTALHRYTTTGVFTIILIVTDNDGFTNTSTTTATITLDSDGDGISDAVEEQLGSNPDNASGVVPLVIAGTSDNLVDTNGDGILDTFYNTQTGTHSTTKLQADGTYLIDVNGDGTWEFIYDPAYGTTTAYKKESPGGFPWLIVGIILAIIVLVVVVLVKKRRL
jgi:parallel beta-helix repeat protein